MKIFLLLVLYLCACSESSTDPEPEPPSVENFSLELDENSSSTFSFLGFDPNDNELTFVINSQPLNGSVSISSNVGTYVPNYNYTGLDSFSYSATSLGGVSNIGNVSILINPADNRKIFSISTLSEDNGTEVILSNDNGFVIVGYSTMHPVDGSEYDLLYVVKTDSKGNYIWSKIVGDTENWYRAYSISTGNDGGYIIVAEAYDVVNNSDKAYILKIDELGNTEWSKTYSGNFNPKVIRKTMDGSYIIADSNLKIMKIDNAGNEIWNKDINDEIDNGSLTHYMRSFVETSDGGIAIVTEGPERSDGNGAGSDAYLIKIDTNGSLLWWKYFGANDNGNGFNDLRETRDKGFIIVGHYNGWTTGGFWLLKTDLNGELVWSNNSAGTRQAFQVELSNDNGYVISKVNDLLKTTSVGNLEWKVSSISENQIISLKKTNDGGYVMISGISTNKYSDIQLIKTDSQGNQEF